MRLGLRQSRRRRTLAWLVSFALVLLLAQTLGLLHGTVHAHAGAAETAQIHDGHLAHAHAAVGESADSREGHGSHEPPSFLSLLFAGHQSDSDCQAYDQLCHFDALTDFATPALLLALQSFVLVLLASLATARWHALFQARGPPSPR